MGKTKYFIYWDFVDNDGFVHIGQSISFEDRDEANKKWFDMKGMSCYANMRAETVKPEEHRVTVAFKTYDYLVEGPVKLGDSIKVIAGGQIVELEVLKVDPPKKPGINYVYAEEVLHK